MGGKAIGVGGVFFTCDDPEATKSFYEIVFGRERNDFGGFDFLHKDSAAAFPVGARTIFSAFPGDSDYFAPSDAPFMVNLIVDDLDGLLARLAASEILPVQPSESHSYGKFAWIMDPDGRKVELWEPIEPSDS